MNHDHEHGHDHGHHLVENPNLDFTFGGPLRMGLLACIVIGLVSMAATWLTDDALGTRFWSNFLHNSVFFTGIAFISLFVSCAFVTAYGGWYTIMKRVWEAYSQFLLFGLILMGVMAISTLLGWNTLYHWNFDGIADVNHGNYDRIIADKSGFINKYVYTFGTFIVLGVWYLFAVRIRSLSVSEDNNGANDKDFDHHNSIRKWSAAFLPIAAFSSAFLIWQWVMSIDAHWYSTMFAWYATASWFVSALCLTMLTLIYLKGKGYYPNLSDEHLHDIGKLIFAFSVFWTYLWFSQFMLIWYGNNGEETIYFRERRDNYPVLFYGNLLINFVLPFLVLMRNSTKRKYGTLIFVSVIVFFGHWWDFFNMIKPGVLHTSHLVESHHGHDAHGSLTKPLGEVVLVSNHDHGDDDDHGHKGHAHDDGHGHEADGHGYHDKAAAHGGGHGDGHDAHAHGDDHGHGDHGGGFKMGFTIPGFLELGTMIGFLGLFLFVIFSHLSRAKLEPVNDPYYEESLHHHV